MPVLNADKLRELVLFLAESSAGDDAWSVSKLPSLMFYCDFTAFARLSASITGAEYVRATDGPSPRELETVLQSLRRGGELADDDSALRPANRELFSNGELLLIERAILRFRNSEPNDILDRGLPFVGWGVAEIGERIPYEIALVGKREPTPDEIEYGRNLHSIAAESLAGDG
jgi:hypothetical protein